MRKMVNTKTKEELMVKNHIILKNFWEYYFTDAEIEDNNEGDIQEALVMGIETEIRLVSMEEIKPYIDTAMSPSKDKAIMPAPGWEWVDYTV